MDNQENIQTNYMKGVMAFQKEVSWNDQVQGQLYKSMQNLI